MLLNNFFKKLKNTFLVFHEEMDRIPPCNKHLQDNTCMVWMKDHVKTYNQDEHMHFQDKMHMVSVLVWYLLYSSEIKV